MKTLIKTLKFVGYLALIIGLGTILIGHISVLLNDGLGAVLALLNPLNVWNFIATLLVLAPGGLLILLADKLEKHES